MWETSLDAALKLYPERVLPIFDLSREVFRSVKIPEVLGCGNLAPVEKSGVVFPEMTLYDRYNNPLEDLRCIFWVHTDPSRTTSCLEISFYGRIRVNPRVFEPRYLKRRLKNGMDLVVRMACCQVARDDLVRFL